MFEITRTKMESGIMWIVLCSVITTVICVSPDDEVSFESLDIKELEANADELQALLDCLLEISECSEIDARIKDRPADLIATNCGDCSPKERQVMRDLCSLLITRKSTYLPQLLSKYDATGNIKHFLDSLTDVPSLANLPAVSGELLDKYYSRE